MPVAFEAMDAPDDFLYRLKQMEELLRFPGVADNLNNAHTIALSIARDAASPHIADLAVKLVAAINELKRAEDKASATDIPVPKGLWRLRLALQEAKSRGEPV